MIRFARTVRLLPIVIIAAVSLFALKVSGLLFDGGYTLGERLAERGKPQMTITTADSVPAYPKIVMADGKTRPALGHPARRRIIRGCPGPSRCSITATPIRISPARCPNRKSKAEAQGQRQAAGADQARAGRESDEDGRRPHRVGRRAGHP